MAARCSRLHHSFLLQQILTKIDFLEETIARLNEEIDGHVRPFAATLANLDTIPGLIGSRRSRSSQQTGGNMAQLSSAAHLCGWAAMWPGQNESAGRRRSGKTGKANRALPGFRESKTREHGAVRQLVVAGRRRLATPSRRDTCRESSSRESLRLNGSS